ncbi:ABC transporter permease [Dickeya zeae]|uniref:ABC transporter permease n=1 Tax=Dickeya zeae TaxID=204042 RepID=UPI00205A936F|nr:ABC transporter permease [Dickeya zeae]UPT55538.1 FtsX-like permease family protein [Dickeya zeae]
MNKCIATCSRRHYGMPLIMVWHESIHNIRSLGRKSLLAMSGIIIGCASVVALITTVNNATNAALKVFNGLDINVVAVDFSPGRTGFPPSFDSFSLLNLDKNSYNFNTLAPVSLSTVWLKYNKKVINRPVVGSTPFLENILSLKVSEGRFISFFDKSDRFIVVGSNITSSLNEPGTSFRIGDKIEINGYLYTIIGILEYKSRNPIFPVDINNSIIVSSNILRKINRNSYLDHIIFKMTDEANAITGGDKIKRYISTIIQCCEIETQIPQQLIDGMTSQSRIFSYLLAGLSGISLISGGIGIMNVMVMSVAARRKEIGLRMAIGARPQDIRNLFLSEAILIAIAGSVTGAFSGFIISYIFVCYLGWTFSPVYYSIPLGTLSSIAVGLIAGWLPASKASKMEPVRALRDD